MINSRAIPEPVNADAPLFIVLNVKSSTCDALKTREVIEGILSAAGREHHVRIVTDAAQLHDAARQTVDDARARGGVVVAGGGDGTINTMAQATLGSGCSFGVLPLGTFNYFSRTHGIPDDTADATRLLLTARAHPVQVGLVNGRVFLINASLGMYPELLEDREAFNKKLGRTRLVAVIAGVSTVLRHHRQLHLLIEQGSSTRQMRSPVLFVGNNRLQLENAGIAGAPVLDQGQLNAITLRPMGTLTMLWLALRGAFGRLGEAESVASFAFRRIVVQPAMPYGTRRFKVAIDGEIVWLRAPIEFRVAAQALHLLKPDPKSDVVEPA
ncbi:MAG: diacylglycerol kinase [Sandarakinorhabdus sp.]|nr:diacylglycerol kinase [Sandarakinorhabdus sp.]